MAWTCPTCAASVETTYCAVCGERQILARELTLRGLLRQFVNAVSSVDGRVVRTLRTLIARPGALTVAWVEGPRKPYVGPIQLFLLANVVFVAVQSLTGTNIFSSTLSSHLHHQDWSPIAQRLVAARLEKGPTTLQAYEIEFNRAVALYAKSLVIAMTVPFALLVQAIPFRRRRPFALQMVFALHVYAFLLLLYSAGIVMSAVEARLGGAGLDSGVWDKIVTALIVSASAFYLFIAVSRVYGAKGAARVVVAIGLAVAVLAITLAYRFGLLVLTLRVT